MNTAQRSLQIHAYKNYLLIVLGLLSAIVVVWIVVTLFTANRSVELPPGATSAAKTLSPVLDTSSLEKVAQKDYISPDQLESFPINVIVTDEFSKQKMILRIDP